MASFTYTKLNVVHGTVLFCGWLVSLECVHLREHYSGRYLACLPSPVVDLALAIEGPSRPRPRPRWSICTYGAGLTMEGGEERNLERVRPRASRAKKEREHSFSISGV